MHATKSIEKTTHVLQMGGGDVVEEREIRS